MENCYPVTLKTLKMINGESIQYNYNRNLKWKVFQTLLMEAMNASDEVVWTGMKTKVLLTPLMVHGHAQGEPCEQHYRCEVFVNGLLGGMVFLDVPMHWFTDPYFRLKPLNETTMRRHRMQ